MLVLLYFIKIFVIYQQKKQPREREPKSSTIVGGDAGGEWWQTELELELLFLAMEFRRRSGIRVLEDEDLGIRKEERERKWMRAIWGFNKNQIGKGVLVGPGSRACHVLLYFVYFNSILASGDNGRAIGLV